MEDADGAAEAAQDALLHSSGLAQDFFASMRADPHAEVRARLIAALEVSPTLAKRRRLQTKWEDEWEVLSPTLEEAGGEEPPESAQQADAPRDEYADEDVAQPDTEDEYADEDVALWLNKDVAPAVPAEEAWKEEAKAEGVADDAVVAKTEEPRPPTSSQGQRRPTTPPRRPRFRAAKPKPSPRGRRVVSPEELKELRVEQLVADAWNVKWQERGPAGPPGERTKDLWRGQKWRPGSERWANNGGKNKIWYSGFMRAREEGPAALERFFELHAEQFNRGPQSKGGPRELKQWLAWQGAAYESAQPVPSPGASSSSQGASSWGVAAVTSVSAPSEPPWRRR